MPLLFGLRRCWFPCVDHASVLISYDVTVGVTSPKITAAFNGRLLETTDLHDLLEEVDGADVDGGHQQSKSSSETAENRTRYNLCSDGTGAVILPMCTSATC